jgi:hypothetical protein
VRDAAEPLTIHRQNEHEGRNAQRPGSWARSTTRRPTPRDADQQVE